ncbi:peptidoglycan-binding domain-containing protein [Xylanimonas sp. McL0601]|uniref:peptidoglycan-binding domain-containing protein n=1 Tax=Xylanimonas sp. McL0601 TaxID=3414739 RepID=UPI003CE82052
MTAVMSRDLPANANHALATEGAPRKIRRSRWLWGWVVVCLILTVGAFAVGTQVRSPWDDAIARAKAVPAVTAAVEDRTLAAEVPSWSAQVSLGRQETVPAPAPAGARAVVTATVARVHDTVRSGDTLLEVSGRPLIVLELPFPLYRDLGPGTSGPDVEALQKVLADLDIYAAPLDGEYGPATAAGVERLYDRVGYPAPEPSPEARQAVSTANEEFALAKADDPPNPDRISKATQALADARRAALTPLPAAEVVAVPEGGATVVARADVGSTLDDAEGGVATLRTGSPVVDVRIPVDLREQYPPESQVTVRTAHGKSSEPGRVLAVSDFQAASGADTAPGYDVTVALDRGTGFGDGEEVLVTPAAAPEPVSGLAVPLVAVHEDSAGKYLLRVVTPIDSAVPTRTERVDIEVQATGDGYAVVESAALAEGDIVLVSEAR